MLLIYTLMDQASKMLLYILQSVLKGEPYCSLSWSRVAVRMHGSYLLPRFNLWNTVSECVT